MTFSGPNLRAISHLELVNRAIGVPHRDVSIIGKPGRATPNGAQLVSTSWKIVRSRNEESQAGRTRDIPHGTRTTL